MTETKTERLELKKHGTVYLHSTHIYASDPENTVYMINLPNSTIEETMQYLTFIDDQWSSPDQMLFEYAIILNGLHIGAVALSVNKETKIGELGWILNKEYHGNGYATEAARAIIDMAISSDKTRLEKIVAHCDYRNTPSVRVMEKIGLTLESDNGLRKYKGNDNEYKELMYSLLVMNG